MLPSGSRARPCGPPHSKQAPSVGLECCAALFMPLALEGPERVFYVLYAAVADRQLTSTPHSPLPAIFCTFLLSHRRSRQQGCWSAHPA